MCDQHFCMDIETWTMQREDELRLEAMELWLWKSYEKKCIYFGGGRDGQKDCKNNQMTTDALPRTH